MLDITKIMQYLNKTNPKVFEMVRAIKYIKKITINSNG